MSGSETFDFDKFYNEFEPSVIPLDIYTAASLGDVPYFMKYDVGKCLSELSMPNEAGWTPLMYACSKGHSLLVSYLLMCGVDRKCKTKAGVTPLMLAICSGDISTVESMFDFSSMEDKDYRGWTPVFYSVHFTREKCLNYLLSRGANVNVVDFQNETPLMVAIKFGRETMVELILKTATNLEVVSFKNESAIILANESSNKKIQKMVNKRLEELKSQPVEAPEKENVTPVQTYKKKKQTHHCSPTPLKHQLKSQWPQLKMSKSFTYSPNSVGSSPKTYKPNVQSPVWKVMFPKKFWSPQTTPYNDVEKFLKTLGLEKYWPIFRDEEVDFETLLTLNEDNLKELGIVLFGPRKKIYLAIQQLKNRC